MQTPMIIKKISSAVLICALFGQSPVIAKSGGGGGNGGVGNCNGNGNIKHGCGSSVVTPDILTQTSQGNARQPVAPIPTANQLPPLAPPIVPPPTVTPMAPQPQPPVDYKPPPIQVPDPVVPPPTVNIMSPSIPQPDVVTVQPQPIQMVAPPMPIALVPQPIPPVAPPLVPPIAPPMVPQPKPNVPPLAPPLVPQLVPQMVSINTPLNVSPPQNTPPPTQPTPKPQVEVTLKASSAGFNGNMIANTPGRQPADSYALFRNDATGAYRECVVSGLESRKVILANGEVVYRGTLPGFRTVSNEVSDIPSWHPHEAGCIISIEHKKREVK